MGIAGDPSRWITTYVDLSGQILDVVDEYVNEERLRMAQGEPNAPDDVPRYSTECVGMRDMEGGVIPPLQKRKGSASCF